MSKPKDYITPPKCRACKPGLKGNVCLKFKMPYWQAMKKIACVGESNPPPATGQRPSYGREGAPVYEDRPMSQGQRNKLNRATRLNAA